MRARAIRLLLLTLFLPACTATPMPLPGSPDADRMLDDLGGYHTAPEGGPSATLDRGILPPGGDGASVNGIDALPKELPDGGPVDIGPADGGSDGGDGAPLDALVPLDAALDLAQVDVLAPQDAPNPKPGS